MRRIFVTIALLLTFISSQITGARAQENEPEIFCGSLDAEDCQLLKDSAAAMQAVTSHQSKSTLTIELQRVPALELGGETIDIRDATLEIYSERIYSLTDETSRGLEILKKVDPSLISFAMLAAPETVWDILAGVEAEWHFEFTLSENLRSYLSEQANDEIPDFMAITIRLINNVIYVNADEFAESSGLPRNPNLKPWVAVDLTELMDKMANEDAENAAMFSIGIGSLLSALNQSNNLAKLYNDLQLLGELNSELSPGEFVEINKARTRRIQGVNTASFETTTDTGAVGLWATQVLQNLMFQLTPSPDEGAMAALMFLPGMADGISFTSSQYIDPDTAFVLEQQNKMVWRMAPMAAAIRLAVQNDPYSPIQILERNPRGPILTITSKTSNSQFNEPVKLAIPKEVEQAPLDDLFR